jgi:hypothetical protein
MQGRCGKASTANEARGRAGPGRHGRRKSRHRWRGRRAGRSGVDGVGGGVMGDGKEVMMRCTYYDVIFCALKLMGGLNYESVLEGSGGKRYYIYVIL